MEKYGEGFLLTLTGWRKPLSKYLKNIGELSEEIGKAF